MPLEYHKLLCHHAFLDTYFHERVVLFNTETQLYYYRFNEDVEPNSQVFTDEKDYMRLNNYIETIYNLDELAYQEELKTVLRNIEHYEFCYNNPEYSYFNSKYNKCSINNYIDDLPF